MPSLLASAADFILPPSASTVAPELDWLFWFITWVSVIFTVAIFAGVAWLAIKFRHKPGVNDIGSGPTHSNLLEIVWSVIPLIIVVVIAIWGFQGYMNLSVLPPAGNGTMEIQVTAFKWGWNFTYPNGYSESQLHVPVNTNVRLVLTSQDVIHDLYLVQFRVKKDVVPGRFNKFWFNATMVSPVGKNLSRRGPNGEYEDLDITDPDNYVVEEEKLETGDPQTLERAKNGFDIFCAEYCGNGHSRMLSKVIVHPDVASYDKWLATAADIWRKTADGKEPAAVDVGLKLVRNNGCFSCHSINGTTGIGPTWKNMWGHNVSFLDGKSAKVDEEYVRESILYPQKEIVAGFGPSMPSFLGKFSDREIVAIIAYMKSLSDAHEGTDDLNRTVPPPKNGQSFQDYVKSLQTAPMGDATHQPTPNDSQSPADASSTKGQPQQKGEGKNETETEKRPADARQPGPNNAAGAGPDTGK